MSKECFADEIAIDFPSVEQAVERMREASSAGVGTSDVLGAKCSCRGAKRGTDSSSRSKCRFAACAGIAAAAAKSGPSRAPTATGPGEAVLHHAVRVTLPPGRRRRRALPFRVSYPGAESVRVEVRIAITIGSA